MANIKKFRDTLNKHGIEYEENRLNNGTRFYVFQNLFGRLPMKEYFIFENDIYGDITSDFVKIELYNYEPFPVKYDNLKIAVDYANMKEEFEREFNKEFKEEFMLMSKEEFLSKNMLGIGEMHNKIDDFLGNYIAVSVSGSIIVLENYLEKGKGVKKSTHCGLTRDEMEVPIIVLKK